MKNRSIKLIIFGLCAGALIGTLVGNVLSFLLPDGSAVKQFFLISYDFTFGSINSDNLIDLGIVAVSYTHLTLPTISSV